MRTPLNAALLGMSIVEKETLSRLTRNNTIDECEDDWDFDDPEIEIVRDIKLSILATTEICNDLLNFDKV